MIVNSSSIESLDVNIINDLPSKQLIRSFGTPNDFIELNVFDLNGTLIINDPDFKDFTPISTTVNENDTFQSLDIDFTQVLKDYGLSSGIYRTVYSFHSRKITSTTVRPFYITEISPSRTEIRIKSDILDSDALNVGFSLLNNEINVSTFVKDININLGNAVYSLILNIQLDTVDNSILLKLYDPLPPSVSLNATLGIIEEIINPLEVTVNLGEESSMLKGTYLKGPNFNIDFTNNSPISSEFKSYDDILTTGAITSSKNTLQNYLSGSIPVDFDFDNHNTPSGYTFENFIHFSSAVERLKNFEYKLKLIETYDSEISTLNTITGDVSASKAVTDEINSWKSKQDKIIQAFDYYEQYLYFESGTYAWPKSDSTKPYTNVLTTSPAATSWLGPLLPNDQYGSGQLLSASLYDDYNPYKLTNTIPEHIISNNDNAQYITFVEMIAQHFDSIWAYIDNITDINQANSSLKDGISKDLVYNTLTDRGIAAFDQFKGSNIYEYFIGDVKDGTFKYTSTDGSTMVTASNDSSTPKGDITKEVWKRLYHNAPYLLKTKGTERGVKALLACYGIPESILHVKEYGGPLQDKTGFRTFTYPKSSKMVNPQSTGGNTGIIKIDSGVGDTHKLKTAQIRALLSGSRIPIISIQSKTSNPDVTLFVTQSVNNEAAPQESGSYGKLLLVTGSSTTQNISDLTEQAQVTSSLIPLFNGKPWNFTLTIDSGSTNTFKAYATQTTFNKNTYLATCSITSDLALNNDKDIVYIPVNQTLKVFGATIQSYKNTKVHEVRAYTEILTEDTIVTQSLSPFNYNGNTISSSYHTLNYRYALGSNFESLTPNTTNTTAQSLNIAPIPGIENAVSFARVTMSFDQVHSLDEIHHLTTPDTVGSAMVSDKVRIDTGTVSKNWLSPFQQVETSTQDRQPLDYSDLGIFFSPTFEINEDIIYTLGGFRLDDYIGDPSHYTSGSYPDLKTIRDIYFQKARSRFNFYDYIRTVQQFDHTLFRMIKDFVPAKANLTTGVLIEPHYLERTKIAGPKAVRIQEPIHEAVYAVTGSLSSTHEKTHEAIINVEDYLLSGSMATVENNATQNQISTKYFTGA